MEKTSRTRSILLLLSIFQAIDAALCVQPIPYVTRCLDAVHYPQTGRWIFPVVKFASAVGLFVGVRVPAVARLTLLMLTIYFSLAVSAHVRARDIGFNAAAATALLATYGTLTADELTRADRLSNHRRAIL